MQGVRDLSLGLSARACGAGVLRKAGANGGGAIWRAYHGRPGGHWARSVCPHAPAALGCFARPARPPGTENDMTRRSGSAFEPDVTHVSQQMIFSGFGVIEKL